MTAKAKKSQIVEGVGAPAGLLDDVVDLGHLGDDATTKLAQTPVPSNHSESRPSPRCRAVASHR